MQEQNKVIMIMIGGLEVSCTQGATEAQRPAARTARSRLQACWTKRDPLRDTKWAGGSRLQTHRWAALCGFTQDDGDVRGVAPTHDAPRIPADF